MHKSAEILGLSEKRYYELSYKAKTMLGDKLLAEALIELTKLSDKEYSPIEKLYMAAEMGSQNMKNIFSED